MMIKKIRSESAVLFRNLGRNILAGTRLSLFMPVRALDFRVSAGDYAMAIAASLFAWLLGGIAREGLEGYFNLGSLTVALAQLPVVLLVCLFAAHMLGRRELTLALALGITATDVLFEIASVLIAWASASDTVALWAFWLNAVFVLWALATIVRVQVVFSGWHGRKSWGAVALFTCLLVFFIAFLPRSELWTAWPRENAEAPVEAILHEDIFHRQGELLDLQLDALAAQRDGVEDLYFVGLAPYGQQDTFIRELGVVRRLMDERFDAAGRSVVMSNHPSTLADIPMATATQLRRTLLSLGSNINREEDLVVLFLTTHGSAQHELSFELPPLSLQQLNPTQLSRMLADSGIKWKVIVISACYSGGFIEALRDENTLVVTASDATHTSFGCEASSDFTWFSRAYFDQALRTTRSFIGAFERARVLVAEREQKEGFEPSNPQMHVGGAIRGKLESIERRLKSSPLAPSTQAGLRSLDPAQAGLRSLDPAQAGLRSLIPTQASLQ